MHCLTIILLEKEKRIWKNCTFAHFPERGVARPVVILPEKGMRQEVLY